MEQVASIVEWVHLVAAVLAAAFMVIGAAYLLVGIMKAAWQSLRHEWSAQPLYAGFLASMSLFLIGELLQTMLGRSPFLVRLFLHQ